MPRLWSWVQFRVNVLTQLQQKNVLRIQNKLQTNTNNCSRIVKQIINKYKNTGF